MSCQTGAQNPQADRGSWGGALVLLQRSQGCGGLQPGQSFCLVQETSAPWVWITVTSTCPWQVLSSAALPPGLELLPSRLDSTQGGEVGALNKRLPSVPPGSSSLPRGLAH